jgi:hypothetical protein
MSLSEGSFGTAGPDASRDDVYLGVKWLGDTIESLSAANRRYRRRQRTLWPGSCRPGAMTAQRRVDTVSALFDLISRFRTAKGSIFRNH